MSKSNPLLAIINIDGNSKTPKYRQIISSIIAGIEQGKIEKGAKLPSINDLSEWHFLSRDTVEKAYNELKTKGIVSAMPGKGFYVERIDVKVTHKIFLLFNKLSTHKKAIYDNFVATLGDLASVDFYIYNNDYRSFESLITNSLDRYSYYVVMPHFNIESADAHTVLNLIPEGKLILMDKLVDQVNIKHSTVYQNYEKDVYSVLTGASEVLANYKKLVLAFPDESYHPKTICKGFVKAAGELAIDKEIIKSIRDYEIQKGDVLVIVEENDLIDAIKQVRSKQWEIGKEVGIISYNDTPIKEVLADGISVISTDFAAMGRSVAELILDNKEGQFENPFSLIRRKSF